MKLGNDLLVRLLIILATPVVTYVFLLANEKISKEFRISASMITMVLIIILIFNVEETGRNWLIFYNMLLVMATIISYARK